MRTWEEVPVPATAAPSCLSVTFVRGPGRCLQLGRRYGSPGVLSLAQPQVPVHHCQLRGREGEWEPGDCHARTESPSVPRPRPLGPAASSWGSVPGSVPPCPPRGQPQPNTQLGAGTRVRGSQSDLGGATSVQAVNSPEGAPPLPAFSRTGRPRPRLCCLASPLSLGFEKGSAVFGLRCTGPLSYLDAPMLILAFNTLLK